MSQTPQKLGQKMCKSPKNSTNYQIKPEKIDYENLSTNCTVVGSNNLNLVKKPQIVTNMSPAYSNPSPGYPPSPYSSPASLKSPSPNLKPPTPQPSFPVMQIINSHSLLARPIQTSQSQNIIKLKPHLNILPKPSASPQPSPKPSVSPQIVIPTNQPATATIMPTAQPVLLNQMPLLTTPSVQFILRPQTATKIPTQMSTAAPQGLILQPSGQPLLQIPRSQPMVRVLTNGVQLAPATTTTAYVAAPTATTQNVVVNASPTSPTHPKKKPKNKVKKKLDLANLMKLSGIGDEDDIQFESDASQSESEPSVVQEKKIGNIQLSAMPQPAPVVQVLNQNFQSGMISNSSTQPQGMAFNPFITTTPNFTINNGLMVQRSGGFKLTMGEDGRLVLQHDPTLNQDLQSQLILQSIFGLNGGLVLQPSMDQQTVQQTVQSVQTIQQQTIQTVQQQQHTLQPQIQQQTVQQTIQHQTVQSQPLMQQPMQIIQPQQVHSLHSLQSQIQGQLQSLLQQQQNQSVQTPQIPPQSPTFHQQQQQNQPVLKVQPFQKAQPPVQTVHPQPIVPQQQQEPPQQTQPTSYVVNLTPDQLEQLKRNGQLTVNGQTIFMQRPNNNKQQQTPPQPPPQPDECKKLSPKIKPVKKIPPPQPKIQQPKTFEEKDKSSLITALQSPPKHLSPPQKQAIVQPSIKEKSPPKLPPQPPPKPNDSNGTNQDVEKLLGQLLEESGNINIITSATAPNITNKNQRIHTIQLTPQKQEHLKNIQLQIQTLSANLTSGNSEIQAALKMLFAEQQKILATGKLLPPDKVYYHNNHLTIINPSSLNLSGATNKSEGAGPPQPAQAQQTGVASNQVVTSQAPRISSVSSSDHSVQQNTTSQMAGGPRLPVPQQQIKPPPPQPPPPPPVPQPQPPQHGHSIAKKAHLIEAQLSQDQAGAVKPDIHTPFRDKKDACIRLIRYHCMDQPVLSQKDLDKADEIFELTAEHFIAKYAKMVDKYKYLLMKESMRPVQTSELMMLDRMYLSEERQSMIRLRQEAEEAAQLVELQPAAPPPLEPTSTEDYDEWACIQRELGCLPHQEEAPPPKTVGVSAPPTAAPVVANAHAHLQPPKRTASSDSRLETLKRFRVDKHNKKSSESVHNSVLNNNSSVQSVSSGINTHHHPNSYEQQGPNDSYENEVENNSIDEQVQSAIDSILNLQQNTALADLDSILS